MRGKKSMGLVFFLMELVTMLFFIPIIVYLAHYSFGVSSIGFLAGVLVIINYYIYRWYQDQGSLVYFGFVIIGGSLSVALAMFFDIFKDIMFPASYLLEFSQLYLPEAARRSADALYFYYVFITGIGYTNILRYLWKILCNSMGWRCFSSKEKETFLSDS